jgi:hypothetical protein
LVIETEAQLSIQCFTTSLLFATNENTITRTRLNHCHKRMFSFLIKKDIKKIAIERKKLDF